MLHLVGAEDAASESLEETRDPKRELHLLVASARSDARRNRNPIKGLDDSGHDNKLTFEHFLISALELDFPIQTPPKVSLDLFVHVRSRSTNESFHDLGLGKRPPETGQNLRLRTDGEPFAVNEHPVAVKDHEVKPAHRRILSRPLQWRRSSRQH
jgi:hypothetical protein